MFILWNRANLARVEYRNTHKNAHVLILEVRRLTSLVFGRILLRQILTDPNMQKMELVNA